MGHVKTGVECSGVVDPLTLFPCPFPLLVSRQRPTEIFALLMMSCQNWKNFLSKTTSIKNFVDKPM